MSLHVCMCLDDRACKRVSECGRACMRACVHMRVCACSCVYAYMCKDWYWCRHTHISVGSGARAPAYVCVRAQANVLTASYFSDLHGFLSRCVARIGCSHGHLKLTLAVAMFFLQLSVLER